MVLCGCAARAGESRCAAQLTPPPNPKTPAFYDCDNRGGNPGRFKRQVIQENIIGEVKRHSFCLKPGQKLRVKQALARKRNRKKARREPE